MYCKPVGRDGFQNTSKQRFCLKQRLGKSIYSWKSSLKYWRLREIALITHSTDICSNYSYLVSTPLTNTNPLKNFANQDTSHFPLTGLNSETKLPRITLHHGAIWLSAEPYLIYEHRLANRSSYMFNWQVKIGYLVTVESCHLKSAEVRAFSGVSTVFD